MREIKKRRISQVLGKGRREQRNAKVRRCYFCDFFYFYEAFSIFQISQRAMNNDKTRINIIQIGDHLGSYLFIVQMFHGSKQIQFLKKLQFPNLRLGLSLIYLLILQWSLWCFQSFDIRLQHQIFIDPVFLLCNQFFDPFLEQVQHLLLLGFFFFTFVQLLNDLQIFLTVLTLLKFFEAVIQGKLLLLTSLLIIQQVLKLVKVWIILFFFILDTRRIVNLRRDKTGLLSIGCQPLRDLQVAWLRWKNREFFGVGFIIAESFRMQDLKGGRTAIRGRLRLITYGLELTCLTELLLDKLRLGRHYNYIMKTDATYLIACSLAQAQSIRVKKGKWQ